MSARMGRALSRLITPRPACAAYHGPSPVRRPSGASSASECRRAHQSAASTKQVGNVYLVPHLRQPKARRTSACCRRGRANRRESSLPARSAEHVASRLVAILCRTPVGSPQYNRRLSSRVVNRLCRSASDFAIARAEFAGRRSAFVSPSR